MNGRDSPPPVSAAARNSRAGDWDRAYSEGAPPWDIGRPQPVFVQLADAGEIRSPVLDSGCGTGEHAVMTAARGLEVVAVDVAPTAVARARQKARERGLQIEFVVADVLDLGRLGPRFSTVIDSGTFHVFDDADRARYVRSLAQVLEPGGVIHLLCFSDRVPGTYGPRRISRSELKAAFADGWTVERIEEARFEVSAAWPMETPHAWLAKIRRNEP